MSKNKVLIVDFGDQVDVSRFSQLTCENIRQNMLKRGLMAIVVEPKVYDDKVRELFK